MLVFTIFYMYVTIFYIYITLFQLSYIWCYLIIKFSFVCSLLYIYWILFHFILNLEIDDCSTLSFCINNFKSESKPALVLTKKSNVNTVTFNELTKSLLSGNNKGLRSRVWRTVWRKSLYTLFWLSWSCRLCLLCLLFVSKSPELKFFSHFT